MVINEWWQVMPVLIFAGERVGAFTVVCDSKEEADHTGEWECQGERG